MRGHVTGEETVAFAALLLDAGARLDVRDDLLEGTPLGWACRWGRAELVKLLLARGVRSKQTPSRGRRRARGLGRWATTPGWRCSGGVDLRVASRSPSDPRQ